MTEQRQDLHMAQTRSDPGKTVNLFAMATRSGKTVDWKLGFQNPPEQSKARVDLPAKSGPHEIIVHLVATQGLDIDFDTTDPIWVTESGQCPPPNGVNSDQIIVASCTRNLLRFVDKNDGPARTLTYQLNFTGAPALDPEIRNGGTI